MVLRFLTSALMLSTLHSEALSKEESVAGGARFVTELPERYYDLQDGPYGNRVPGKRGWSLAIYGGSGMTEGAVLRALRWLKENQEPDGSWRAESGGGPAGRFNTGFRPAMTGLALAALIGHGETPSSEEFGPCVDRAIAWLIDNQEADGRFRGRDKMNYSHAIATIAICEALAVTGHPEVRRAATRATDLIVRGQNPSGGWNYDFRPTARDDTSFMSWCAQALFAAQAAGIELGGLDTAMARAAAACKKNAKSSGAFGYVGPTDVHNELTTAAVFSLFLLENESSAELKGGLAWLASATCDWQKPWSANPIYHWYYATQAKFHAGGLTWAAWNKDFAPDLIKNQIVIRDAVPYGTRMIDVGFWESPSNKEHCQSRVYATALCTLMLETYYRHTPMFEKAEDKESNKPTGGDVQ